MTTVLVKGRTGTPTRARVLVVSGPQGATELTGALSRLGHDVQEADSVEAAQAAISMGNYDIMFVDAGRYPALQAATNPPTIVVSDNPDATAPQECLGVLPRSTAITTVATLVSLVMDLQLVRTRCNELEVLTSGIRDGSAFVGRSPSIRRLQGAISRAVDSDATVLIEGEHGSGKSLAVRMIHCKGRRGNQPMLVQQASALDPEALTKALQSARGSTLLIEDIEQLPSSSQQMLVRTLKERTSAPPTETPPARIIATTAAHLPEMVARGQFREDLYYRLHVFPIVMPSLRERLDDIPVLVQAMIAQFATASGSTTRAATVTSAAMAALQGMSWPGNVAQLEAVVRRAFFQAAGAPIDRDHVTAQAEMVVRSAAPTTVVAAPTEEAELDEAAIRPFEEEEQRLLSRALQATRGNVRRAAQLLGIGRATLYRKIQQYNLRLH